MLYHRCRCIPRVLGGGSGAAQVRPIPISCPCPGGHPRHAAKLSSVGFVAQRERGPYMISGAISRSCRETKLRGCVNLAPIPHRLAQLLQRLDGHGCDSAAAAKRMEADCRRLEMTAAAARIVIRSESSVERIGATTLLAAEANSPSSHVGRSDAFECSVRRPRRRRRMPLLHARFL